MKPARVDYELIAFGHSLCGPMASIRRWAFTHIGVGEQARGLVGERRG